MNLRDFKPNKDNIVNVGDLFYHVSWDKSHLVGFWEILENSRMQWVNPDRTISEDPRPLVVGTFHGKSWLRYEIPMLKYDPKQQGDTDDDI